MTLSSFNFIHYKSDLDYFNSDQILLEFKNLKPGHI